MNKKIIEPLVLFLVLLFIILVGKGLFFPKNNIQEKELFLIKQGEGVSDIAENLESEGLINNSFFFNFYVFVSGNRPNLQAGQYSLSPSMNTFQITQKIIKGDTVKEIIIIPEGWDLRDIAWYLEGKGLFQTEELFELIGLPATNLSKTPNFPKPKKFDYKFLESKPDKVSLEGFIFPDTYKLEKGFKLETFVKQALSNFDKKLDKELRKEIKKQDKSVFEIVTMASMIEKEVTGKEEKKVVSGILWKRLKNNIALQVDPTILYFTGKESEILQKDLDKDSSYNTYTNKGLPLGPICNPGLDSIKAAIYPTETEYWYYLSTPERETIFSKTLREHNIAKAKHLK